LQKNKHIEQQHNIILVWMTVILRLRLSTGRRCLYLKG